MKCVEMEGTVGARIAIMETEAEKVVVVKKRTICEFERNEWNECIMQVASHL